MFRSTVLLLAIASCAAAQTPQELLRLAQDAYTNPDGYEIKGKGSMQANGSSWQALFDVTIAASPSPFDNPRPPARPAGRVGGKVQFVNVLGGTDEKPEKVNIPFAVAGHWENVAENVDSITETGAETLPLNGVPTKCRDLQVQYKAPANVPKPAPITYSICSERHIVLKKVMFYAAGPRPGDPSAKWTILFDTAQFNRPAPQWLLDMKELPAMRTHQEWTNKPAPEFNLKDLNGNSVELSSMRGKVVLLDFWSIYCGPCIREMPIIEAVTEAHKDDLVVWGVSSDQPDRDKKWLLEHQKTLPTVSDLDYAVSDLYKVPGIPLLVLVGKDGKIRNYWEGEVPKADLEAAVRQANQY